MKLSRGVVLAWKRGEVEASDLDIDSYRDQAKRWIEQHGPMSAQEARSYGARLETA